MSELHRLADSTNQTEWMKLVMRAQVGEGAESRAILAAHNELVALQRAASSHDDTVQRLTWEGEDPMWTAILPGARIAVVVTDDDEGSVFNYQAWLASEANTGQPLYACGPQGVYTLDAMGNRTLAQIKTSGGTVVWQLAQSVKA